MNDPISTRTEAKNRAQATSEMIADFLYTVRSKGFDSTEAEMHAADLSDFIADIIARASHDPLYRNAYAAALPDHLAADLLTD